MIRLTEALSTNKVGKYRVGDKVVVDGKPGRISVFEFSKTKTGPGVGWWARIQFADGSAQWFDMNHIDKLKRESINEAMRNPTEWGGAKIHFDMIRRGRSSHDYIATLVSGNWPSDEDLITLADGDKPPASRHFGGAVHSAGPGKKHVTVYVD